MSSIVPLPASSPAPGLRAPHHCPMREYVAFIAELDVSEPRRRRHASSHQRFVHTFPDLTTWFAQPLRQRLGWRNGEDQNRRTRPDADFDATTGWINFQARHYVIYLGLTGRLQLDWGWLLGIGVLKPFQVADQMGLPFREHVNHLQERLIALGTPTPEKTGACPGP